MKEPTLADEFAQIIERNDPPLDVDMWVWENRERILAALRAIELVRANLLGFASPAELALANEAGERDE